MGENSKIEWTDHTYNPWWGCSKVSSGCKNCYAEALSDRFHPGAWGETGTRRGQSEKYWAQPLKWDRAAKKEGVRRRVFCGSMCDVFEDRAELQQWRERLWQLIEQAANLDWLLLTKRPENIAGMLPHYWERSPLLNVRIGISAEDQETYEKRFSRLYGLWGFGTFLSYEPSLGPLDLTTRPCRACNTPGDVIAWPCPYCRGRRFEQPDWAIVGSESGPNARPMDLAWARTVRDQCAEAGVAFFMKQICDKHGRKIPFNRWPVDLRVRDYPTRSV